MERSVTPLVAILMPVYNCQNYLDKAIKSILSQTYQNFEFIIINDNSNDDTEKIIRSFKDIRIRYFKNKKNLGLAQSLNKGIKIAKGKYIARMDGDDISLPQRIEKQVKYMEQNSGISVCGTNAIIIDEYGKFNKYDDKPLTNEEIKLNLFFNNPLIHPSVIFRKNVFENYQYNPNLSKGQDYELWVRLSLNPNIKFANLSERLFKYRLYYTNERIKNISLYDKIYELNLLNFSKTFDIKCSEFELKSYIVWLSHNTKYAENFLNYIAVIRLVRRLLKSIKYTKQFEYVNPVNFYINKLLYNHNYFIDKSLYLYFTI